MAEETAQAAGQLRGRGPGLHRYHRHVVCDVLLQFPGRTSWSAFPSVDSSIGQGKHGPIWNSRSVLEVEKVKRLKLRVDRYKRNIVITQIMNYF